MTDETIPPLLRFEPAFMERIWGGQGLTERFGLPLPGGAAIGEAWLVSDHPAHASVVSDGPLRGATLTELLGSHPGELLGTLPEPTAHGRFPLLLKLLDAHDNLSVQVHPDDELAAQLGEKDGGKTEGWHILHAAPGSVLITGFDQGCTPGEFAAAAQAGELEARLATLPVAAGDSVYIPAGTVHAIGKGIMLAEIQQNSDLTYRIYDYNRAGPDGQPRALHLDSALKAIKFGWPPAEKAVPVSLRPSGARRRTLEAACPFFATERIEMDGVYSRNTGGRSFHILLGLDGSLTVNANGVTASISPGQSVLVPGMTRQFGLTGNGTVLDYFVAHPELDIINPVREADMEN